MSDVFKLQRGAAMSTLFFGHEQLPIDRDGEQNEGPDAAGLAPVTWLPSQRRQDPQDDSADSTRGY